MTERLTKETREALCGVSNALIALGGPPPENAHEVIVALCDECDALEAERDEARTTAEKWRDRCVEDLPGVWCDRVMPWEAVWQGR